MSMEKITDLIYAAAKAVADSVSLPVKYPNMNSPDVNEYIELVHIPNGPAKELLNASKNTQGILKMGVYSEPNKGELPTVICDLICAAFPMGRKLFGTGLVVEFYREPVINGAIENGQNVLYPVTLYYRSFAS